MKADGWPRNISNGKLNYPCDRLPTLQKPRHICPISSFDKTKRRGTLAQIYEQAVDKAKHVRFFALPIDLHDFRPLGYAGRKLFSNRPLYPFFVPHSHELRTRPWREPGFNRSPSSFDGRDSRRGSKGRPDQGLSRPVASVTIKPVGAGGDHFCSARLAYQIRGRLPCTWFSRAGVGMTCIWPV
jgi:hypothetical protein